MAPLHRGLLLDDSAWPLVTVRIGNAVSRTDMETWLLQLDGLLSRGPFASVVLVKQRGELDRSVFGQYGEFAKANRARMEERWLGAAFVLPQPVFRFVLSAVLLAAPTAVPHEVFGAAGPAAVWCAERLRAKGIAARIPTEAQLWGDA